MKCKSLKDFETSWSPLAMNPEVCTCFSAVASRIPSSGSLGNRGHADLFSSAGIWIRLHGELTGEDTRRSGDGHIQYLVVDGSQQMM